LFYDDIVHEFVETMQNNDHCGVQGHSRWVSLKADHTTAQQPHGDSDCDGRSTTTARQMLQGRHQTSARRHLRTTTALLYSRLILARYESKRTLN